MIKVLFLNILLTFLIYCFLNNVFKIIKLTPSVKSIRNVTGIKNIGKKQKDITDRIIDSVEKLIKKVISVKKVNIEKRKEVEENLKRINSKDTYERYIAKTVITPIITFMASWIFAEFIGNATKVEALVYFIKAIGLVMAFLLCFSPRMELRKKLNEKEEKIIKEMPRFIRTFRYSPKTKEFDKIVRDYLVTAKDGLKYDLKILSADIILLGEEKALKNFSNRVRIPEVQELVTVLLTSFKGSRDNIDMNLFFVETKFQQKIDKISEKEMKKRLEVLEPINYLLLQGLAILMIAPMAIHSFTGLKDIMN